MQRVFEVTNAIVSLSKSNPVQVIVYAEGKATSSGWKNPSLGAWSYISTPEDGIQDFDFIAEKPTGISMLRVSPIAAQIAAPIDPANYWGTGKPLNGVRIHARNGAIEASLTELQSDTFVPWPWPW